MSAASKTVLKKAQLLTRLCQDTLGIKVPRAESSDDEDDEKQQVLSLLALLVQDYKY